MILYLLLVVGSSLGWLLYAQAKGLSPAGVVLTPVLGAFPLILLIEGGRQALLGHRPQAAMLLGMGLVLVGYIFSGTMARSMMFPGDPLPVPAHPPGLELVEYQASDGTPLRGAAVRAQGTRRASAVYFHGNAESAARNFDIGRELAKLGFDVFLAEYRGYGGCPGSPSEAGLFLDGEAAVASACERFGVAREELVLIGRSLGTGVACELAGRGVGRRLVLLSPYTSMHDMAALMVPRPLAWLGVRDVFDSRSALAKSSQPVFVIHGRRDGVIPYRVGAALAQSLGEARCSMRTIENAGHNDLLAGRLGALLSEIAEFSR